MGEPARKLEPDEFAVPPPEQKGRLVRLPAREETASDAEAWVLATIIACYCTTTPEDDR